MNNAAVHQASQLARRNSQVTSQNPLRQQLIRQVVGTVLEASITSEDLVELSLIVQEAHDKDLEPAQLEQRFRGTPLASLADLLPSDRSELYAFVTMLVTILGLLVSIVALHVAEPSAQPPPIITPQQVEQIVQQVVEQVEKSEHPAPPAPAHHE